MRVRIFCTFPSPHDTEETFSTQDPQLPSWYGKCAVWFETDSSPVIHKISWHYKKEPFCYQCSNWTQDDYELWLKVNLKFEWWVSFSRASFFACMCFPESFFRFFHSFYSAVSISTYRKYWKAVKFQWTKLTCSLCCLETSFIASRQVLTSFQVLEGYLTVGFWRTDLFLIESTWSWFHPHFCL